MESMPLPLLLLTAETVTPAGAGKARVSGGVDGAEHESDGRFVSANVAVLTRMKEDGLKTMEGSR